MDFFIFFGALLGLGLSGDWLVRGASGLGTNFKLSKAFIGLTVVSAGTSAPELVVSLQAVLGDKSDISMGNVVGSNIMNIALILGVTCLVYPIVIKRRVVRLEWPFMFLASIVFFLLIRDGILDRLEAIFLFLSFLFFLIYLITITREEEIDSDELGVIRHPMLNVGMLIIGGAGLAFCGDWMIYSAGNIAHSFGVSDRFIGLTLFALGTSLPELVTSIVAAYRKENDIIVGNIIGSNIFNILLVMGTVGTVKPINASEKIIQFDAIWMIGVAFLLFALMFTGKRLSKLEGAIMLSAMGVYLYLLF